MLMPITPCGALDTPIPAIARPQPFGAAACAGGSAAELAPPLVAQQPQIARMHIPIGMAVQAPAGGTKDRLHLRTRFPCFKRLARPLASPPLHELLAFPGRHRCPLPPAPWENHGYHVGYK